MGEFVRTNITSLTPFPGGRILLLRCVIPYEIGDCLATLSGHRFARCLGPSSNSNIYS